MVGLCFSCALRVNHLTHNQQISRSTLKGNIYFYQLFITFNSISFKNMEPLVFRKIELLLWTAGFGRVCAAWNKVFPEVFVRSIYLWFNLKKYGLLNLLFPQHYLLANSYFGLECTSKGKRVCHSWKMIAVNARVLVSALQTTLINLN